MKIAIKAVKIWRSDRAWENKIAVRLKFKWHEAKYRTKRIFSEGKKESVKKRLKNQLQIDRIYGCQQEMLSTK